jgi:hypothetical protein
MPLLIINRLIIMSYIYKDIKIAISKQEINDN